MAEPLSDPMAGPTERLPVLGILIDPVSYDEAVRRIIAAARAPYPLAATALAVHGVMEGVLDEEHAYRLNALDLTVPDGQPIRWALNLRYGAGLADRCYGPELTLRVCRRAAEEGLPIALIGSSDFVLERLAVNLRSRFPGLRIAYRRPSVFRRLDDNEAEALAQAVRDSGARLAFIGLGCPRQEVFVFENRERMGIPLLAVGAAFDFHAGTLKQAPALLQRMGLEWVFRLAMEPRRLWKRYAKLNPAYVVGFIMQIARVPRFDRVREGTRPVTPLRFG